MPRKFLARYLPDPDALRHQRGFRYLGRCIQDSRFFHLNRHSVAGAAAIGAFLAYARIIGQMLIAALLAMWMRVNVIIAVAAVWISNPVTMPVMLYFSYHLGARLMGRSAPNAAFQPSLDWVWERLEFIWAPFLLGCFVAGAAAALRPILRYMACGVFMCSGPCASDNAVPIKLGLSAFCISLWTRAQQLCLQHSCNNS